MTQSENDKGIYMSFDKSDFYTIQAAIAVMAKYKNDINFITALIEHIRIISELETKRSDIDRETRIKIVNARIKIVNARKFLEQVINIIYGEIE